MSAAYPRVDAIVWREPPLSRLCLLAFAALIAGAFYRGLLDLMTVWDTQPEYSYGYAMPFVAAYFLWQKRFDLARQPFFGSWWGTALVALGIALLVVGQISTLGTIVQYGLLCAVAGGVLAYAGPRAFRSIAAPLAMLLFMVPLPNYVLRELSQWLQLVSSQLGVEVIRAFGVSVHLEGNVIDLGNLKLQVVEACNGLRYLFPLAAIGYIAASMYRAALWKRILLVVSTVPITVLMNSFRIGLVGVTSEYGGKRMAEGVLHDFEGWFVFMGCVSLLLCEMWVLTKLGRERVSLREAFGMPPAVPPVEGAAASATRSLERPFLAACVLAALACAWALTSRPPEQVLPAHKSLDDFPMRLGAWQGRPERLDAEILDALKLNEYVLADYWPASGEAAAPVNLYVAYYASQRDGNSAHSPRACIPGDGWEIVDLEQREIAGLPAGAEPALRVNRAVIQKGEHRQLVYYWFQQRGRYMTGEYTVKLNILRDALTRGRTDGAMVRLVARLRPGEAAEAGDRQLEDFLRQAFPVLPEYIPE